MNPEVLNWKKFHSYRVFDEFLEKFVLQRKSYVTRHENPLDLEAALNDIEARFIAAADVTANDFEQKVAKQFAGASEQTKIVFANVEYLWAMPMGNISPKRKRSYALRWFSGAGQVVSGESYFFGYPHIIADPGPWYLTNKYWEIIAALRVLSMVVGDPNSSNLGALKTRIAEICHDGLYKGVPSGDRFAVGHFCGIHPALMHLADPERYESIISDSHRTQIVAVFGHVVENPPSDAEQHLKEIRNALYESHGTGDDADFKYRWFFYTKDVRPLWIDKKGKRAQRISSAVFDVRNEEDATDLEGEIKAVRGYSIRRSAKLVKATKERDDHTCRACGFHFEDQIVHVHHLDPLSEYLHPRETKLDDLVTLCPNCHYLAHYWLKTSACFKQLPPLLEKLRNSGMPPRRSSAP